MSKIKKIDLETLLENLKRTNPELKNTKFSNADGRCGSRVALAILSENGTLDVKTSFYTYTEMNAFLFGYNAKSIFKP